ncbi:hypothetical protein GL981_12960 (plasmid) [Spiroplasma citri]|nr:hypothetical protein GL981_12960 [Spiroplasma citri]
MSFTLCYWQQRKFLLETIELIKNNKDGIENQALEYNIGCNVEGDVSHYIKAVKGEVQKYIVKKHLIICNIASMLRLIAELMKLKLIKNRKLNLIFLK